MRINIDVNKSIEHERLKPINLTISTYFSVGLYILLAFIFILIGLIFPTALIIKMIKINDLRGLGFILLFYVIGFLTFYGIIKDNNLKKFRGKELEENKKAMISLIKEKFKTELIYEGDKMITYYKRPDFWRFGTRLIVCFNERDVLINISKFNQYGLKSFFHQPFIDRTINSIIRDFNEKI